MSNKLLADTDAAGPGTPLREPLLQPVTLVWGIKFWLVRDVLQQKWASASALPTQYSHPILHPAHPGDSYSYCPFSHHLFQKVTDIENRRERIIPNATE